MERVAETVFEHRHDMSDETYLKAFHLLQQLYNNTVDDNSELVNGMLSIASNHGFLQPVSRRLMKILTVKNSSIEN